MKQFSITRHKGFHMKFANGWSISVQWGPGSHCDNYNAYFHAPAKADYWDSKTAECAVFGPDNRMVRLSAYESVEGHMTADAVADLIHRVATGTFVEPAEETLGEEF